jgi:tetratricopeptide (TPR) repeat protein
VITADDGFLIKPPEAISKVPAALLAMTGRQLHQTATINRFRGINMNIAVRIFCCFLLGAMLWMMPGAAQAESRGSALKRADKQIRQGSFDEAEKIYRHLIEKNPEDKEARLGLSFVLLKGFKLQEAYEEAARVLAMDSLNARGYALLGTALLRAGEFRQSVESLRTAIQLNNRESLAMAGIAEIAYFENNSKLAYEGYRRAIELSPNEPDYYVSLARACSRLEYYAEAADAYQRFLEVAPKTDEERRSRIRGLIEFYRYLGMTKLHRVSGTETTAISFDLIGNRPFLNININGKASLRFVIDTGASLSVISEKAAEKLGIKPVARGGNARAVGGSGTFPIVYTVLNSLTIGETKIEMVPAYIRTVHVTDETPPEARADGYLGLSVLSSFALTLDYQSRRLTLDRSSAQKSAASPATSAAENLMPAEGSVPIRTTSGGLASAEAHIPTMQRPLNFIVDTGASVTVVSKSAVKRHNLESLKMADVRARVIGAAGVEDDVEALSLETFTVNGLRKQNARALILDLDPVNETSGFEQHGILGGDFLTHFLVYMDLRRFEMRLIPQSSVIQKVSSNQ